MTFSIDQNIARLASKTNAKPARIKQAIVKGLDEAGRESVRQMKAAHQPHSKSSKLLRSIRWRRTGEFSRVAGPFMNERYPLYVEKGRGPVYPKLHGLGTGLKHSVGYTGKHIGAVALRFVIGGKVLFRRSVGPADPRPFAKPAHQTMKVLFPKIMQKEIRSALKS